MRTENFEITIDDRVVEVEYVSHDSLTSGDYGGYGYIGHVNIEVIEAEKPETSCRGGMGWSGLETAVERNSFIDDDGKVHLPEVVTLDGGYNSQECWLLVGDFADEIIGELEQYPILDESAVSEFESNALDDQISDIYHDFRVALEQWIDDWCEPEHYARVMAAFEALDDDQTDEYLRAVNNGDLPVEQDSGYECQWYLTDEEIHAEAVGKLLIAETDISPIGVANRLRRENMVVDMFAA